MKIAALFCAFSILLLLLGGCAGQDAEITVTTSDPLAAQATRARGPFLGCSSWEKLVGWFRELKAQGSADEIKAEKWIYDSSADILWDIANGSEPLLRPCWGGEPLEASYIGIADGSYADYGFLWFTFEVPMGNRDTELRIHVSYLPEEYCQQIHAMGWSAFIAQQWPNRPNVDNYQWFDGTYRSITEKQIVVGGETYAALIKDFANSSLVRIEFIVGDYLINIYSHLKGFQASWYEKLHFEEVFLTDEVIDTPIS